MENKNEFSNIPPSIEEKIGRCLHNKKNHPIEIIKKKIYEYFDNLEGYKFEKFDNFSPVVTVEENFDRLLIPKDHPARKKTDTYYVNENMVLRTHTSAHQNELLAHGYTNFLVSGDVYRKDEIDKCHYPIFHQMEGVIKIVEQNDQNDQNDSNDANDANDANGANGANGAIDKLLKILGRLVNFLFPGCKYRINDDYFPFTNPSYEIEVYHNGRWLEILGCGVMEKEIVKNNNLNGKFIAFGLGLERLVMIMFDIPDIRYLWSTHERFINQFKNGDIIKFKPYSELPNVTKDISFWIPDGKIKLINSEEKWIDENDFYELAREYCGIWIEEIKLMDKFYHKKKGKYSRMYRIIYSPSDPSLKDPSEFNKLINKIQNKLRDQLGSIDIELR